MDTLGEDVFTLVTIRIPLRTRNVSDKSCRDNQNTHFIFSNFFSENCAVCEIKWKNVVERERSQVAIRQWNACWISKATRTQANACDARTHRERERELCNMFCFSTATIVSWTRPTGMLYVHCLSCVWKSPGSNVSPDQGFEWKLKITSVTVR
jgi:hypothetical protein